MANLTMYDAERMVRTIREFNSPSNAAETRLLRDRYLEEYETGLLCMEPDVLALLKQSQDEDNNNDNNPTDLGVSWV